MTPKEREQFEQQLAGALARLGVRHRNLVLANVGSPPRFENIPNSVWEIIGKEDGEALRRFLGDVFEQAGLGVIARPNVPFIDDAAIVSRASQFLERYTFTGPGSITTPMLDTTRTTVRRVLQSFFNEPDVNMGELRQRLTPIFGPARAEMVASTEVTRAIYEGERAAVQAVADEHGIMPKRARWITDNDDLVCPICGPLHRKPNTNDDVLDPTWNGLKPPAHPRCRCEVAWEYTGDA